MPTTSTFGQSRLRPQIRERLSHLRTRLLKFLFPETSDSWLSILRIGLGAQIVLYCLLVRRDWDHIFGEPGRGWISRELLETLLRAQAPLVPRFGWMLAIGNYFGFSEETVLRAGWILLFTVACFLLVGFCCRVSAIVTWFLHLCAVSGGVLTYGMDNFTTIGLFYLMLAPFPDHYSFDRILWKSSGKDRHLHGFFRRVLQLHLCIIYFFSGLNKCLGAGWWNGDNMWLALTRPPFNVLPIDLIRSCHFVLPLAGIAVCILETCYPFFIWPRRTRPIWFVSILAMHVAIGLAMGLYLFGLIMIILNIAAFGPGAFGGDRTNRAIVEAKLTGRPIPI